MNYWFACFYLCWLICYTVWCGDGEGAIVLFEFLVFLLYCRGLACRKGLDLYFIGDIHGEFKTYSWMISRMALSGNVHMDYSIQVGDTGIFREKDLTQLPANLNHRWFRGNHDSPIIYNDHPCSLSDFGHNTNKDLFWVGGAKSTDILSRKQYIDYWPDEELSYSVQMAALELYSVVKPRVMCRHDCPSEVRSILFGYDEMSSTNKLLQCLLDIHKPEFWIFGHYHRRIERRINNVNFVCLADTRSPVKDVFFCLPDITW